MSGPRAVRWRGVTAALGFAVTVAAQDLDDQRSAWRFRRPVASGETGAGDGGFAALPIPPEVAALSQGDLRDLRLLEPDGAEVPYVRDVAETRYERQGWTGWLSDTRQERRGESVWTMDLSAVRTFDRVTFDIPHGDFAKRGRLELSDDGTAWRTAASDAGLFERAWGLSGRVHHTLIDLAAPASARYVRLTVDDRKSKPIEVRGVTVSEERRWEGTAWSRPAPLTLVETRDGRSRYRLDVPPGLAFESLTLDTDDAAFARLASVEEVKERNGRREAATLGQRSLYRLNLAEAEASGEDRLLRVQAASGGELFLIVEDGDSPPLRGLRATVSAPVTRLLFPAARARSGLTLYYGNPRTRAPVYDLESLGAAIKRRPRFAAVSLGPESANPRFRTSPPLPFPAAVGAALPRPRWQAGRRLPAVDQEDVYTLFLAPEDVAAARPDLADVRLVDGEERQVPYILEPEAAEVPVALTREPLPADSARPAVSRYRLVARSVAGDPIAVPWSALVLTTAESFFARPARILAGEAGRSGGERAVFAGTLTAGGAAAETGGATLTLPLGRPRVSEMVLEIDEGDNAPLSLTAVEALVPVPRLAFKVKPGTYDLLLGNEQAEAPRYDIALLRGEVLAHSAVVLRAGPLETNRAFRPAMGDYFRRTPPAAILWVGLLGAVVALLFLTLRILRQPPPVSPPEAGEEKPPTADV